MKKTLLVALLSVGFGVAAYSQSSTTTTSATNLYVQPAPFPPLASNYDHRFGAGIILGEPTGFSLKYWLNDRMAVDGALGASFQHSDEDESSFYMHGDVLWHNFDLLPVPSGRLPVYFGVGGLLRVRDDQDNEVGIRVPVGLSYMFENAPIDVFVEIGPALDLAPNVRGEVTGGIGVRFWF